MKIFFLMFLQMSAHVFIGDAFIANLTVRRITRGSGGGRRRRRGAAI